MKQLLYLCMLLCAAVWGASSSCNAINPPEVTPTYVQVDSFAFSQGSVVPGTASHKITSVYAFWGGSLLGIFYLPAKIPVAAQSRGTLTLLAGVDFNALHGQQMNYPFFTASYDTLEPQPGATVVLHPAVSYAANVRTAYQEDFEGGTGFVHLAGADSVFARTTLAGQAYEGANAGAFTLPAGSAAAEVIATNAFAVAVGQEAYLELNYHNDMPIQIGLQGYSGILPVTSYIIGLKPRPDWNKVYISLKEFVSSYQTGPYKVILRASPEGGAGGQAFIDNLRVVTF